MDRKLLFFKGLQRFVTEGAGSDLLEVRQLAHGLNSMSDTFAEFDVFEQRTPGAVPFCLF